MSILIRGVEMPTDCAMLLKIFPDGNVGVPVHLNWVGTMVLKDAEAVPVPPHGRLIDADAFIKENAYFADRDFNNPRYDTTLRELVGVAPTIIEAEEGET